MNSLFWYRRDLRLYDNKALSFALKESTKVFCCFIFDPKIIKKFPNDCPRIPFLHNSLKKLQDDLKKKNSDLIFFVGDPKQEIINLCRKLKISKLYFNHDYEPDAIIRDEAIAKKLSIFNITTSSYKDQVIFEKKEIVKKDGDVYKVFTAYKNAWKKKLEESPREYGEFKLNFKTLAKSSDLIGIKTALPSLEELRINQKYHAVIVDGGTTKALKLLKIFFKTKILKYEKNRNLIYLDETSKLGPHLRFGTISIRHIFRELFLLDDKKKNCWQDELIWREFFFMICTNFPHTMSQNFNPRYNHINWNNNHLFLKKWINGETGYPIIDAAMIHFKNTGLMHNRLRMIVASFLTKNLMINWQEGEKYFSTKLLDHDPAINNGNWQWVASTGCDAAPYFRIFNPETQSKKFDPEGVFIKKHLPILNNFPKKFVHTPYNSSIEIQLKAKCIIGKDYPLPIIDLKESRNKALYSFQHVLNKWEDL